MKACTYCGHANEDSAIACGGCGKSIPSPEQPDPAFTDPGERLVALATFPNVVEATLLKLRLEAAGIESCLPEEYSAQMLWNEVAGQFEGVHLCVRARDETAARAVLAEPGDASAPPPLPPAR